MKILKKFGVAKKDYVNILQARNDTYTTRSNTFPSTNLACDENPYKDELNSAKYVLDFGCGVGRNLRWIMENTTAKYVGLDPNKSMTQFFWEVQYKEHGNLANQWKDRVTIANEFSEIEPNIRFDYVVSTFVLQHLGYRYVVPGGLNLTEITRKIFSYMNNDAVFFTIEHESEEYWIDRWTQECNITLDVYIRSYKGLPELTHRDFVTYDGHHLMIFRKPKEI